MAILFVKKNSKFMSIPKIPVRRTHRSPAKVARRLRVKKLKTLPFKELHMRFMVIVKATKKSEAGEMPSMELLNAMGKYNQELINAGVMLAGDGLHASSKGARVKFSGEKRTVIDGPFAETKELIAGFWIWQCKNKQEAIEWVKRCPNPMPGEDSEIEIRQLFESADFGPEVAAQEDAMRDQIAQQSKK
jgi:hypothetical protein